MADVMVNADLAIISFGEAYELAFWSASNLLRLTSDYSESATAFVDAGIAINLGVYENVTPLRAKIFSIS